MDNYKLLVCSVFQCNASTGNTSAPALLAPANATKPRSGCNLFYTAVTPLIVLIGCIGNCLCIRVFTMRHFANQTASVYFAFLSGADLLVLVFYVVPDWLQNQDFLPEASKNWLQMQIVCQLSLFFFYSFRMVSVWMLVTSTVERYIGVRHPLLRRRFCTMRSARRIIFLIVTVCYILCLWKPFMHVTQPAGDGFRCGQRPSVSTRLLFVLDTSYAAMLTIVPSVLLFIFNSLISRHLLIVRRSRSCMNHDVVGHQFAFLLVLVSTTFLVLTWPYYLCWVTSFIIKFNIKSDVSTSLSFENAMVGLNQWRLGNAIYITKTLYYMTYSVNFFLYSYASNFFRSEMKRMFTVRGRREKANRFYQASTQDYRLALPAEESSGHRSTNSGLLDRYRKLTIKRMPTMRKPAQQQQQQQIPEMVPMMELGSNADSQGIHPID